MKKKRKSIIFRTDTNEQLGTGHMMRCYSLASAWNNSDGQSILVTSDYSLKILNRFEETGVKIDVQEDGKVLIASTDEKKAKEALEMVQYFTAEVEVGKIYTGKVTRIVDFGAFVEIFPGKEGLVHISQLEDKYVENVRKVVKEGDEILVKVMDIDSQGRIALSRKQALHESKEKETDS